MSRFSSVFSPSRITGLVACAVIAVCSVWFCAIVSDAETNVLAVVAVAVFAALVLLDARSIKADASRKAFRLYWAFIPGLVFCFWVYMIDAFGFFDWGTLFLHADGGLFTPKVAIEYIRQTSLTICAIAAFLIALGVLKARGTLTRTLDIALMVFALAVNPMIAQPIEAAILPNKLGGFLAERFVPIEVDSPLTGAQAQDKPVNLLRIFIESAERTYFNEAEFGDVMRSLREFDERGLSARDMVQLEYTYNSISGMVGSDCGVPFFMTSFTTQRYLEKSDTFLPGITCLGDLLKARGYQQGLVSGWPLEFTGQGSFFRTHGYTSLNGSAEVLKAIGGAGSPFGADDGEVLDFSRQLLKEFNQTGRPFALTVVVSGGHAIDGYLSERCAGTTTGLPASEPNILHAARCTNGLVADFIHRAEEEGLIQNTILVLQSDHLTQPSTVTDRLNKYERRNFFSLSGPGVSASAHPRPASTFDIFPTIAQAMRLPLVNHRAGLGTSLLSDQPTLVEAVGEALLNSAIKSENVLSRSLWEPRATQLSAAN